MDIREILQALSDEDRLLWSQHRTEMRKSYLNAHNMTVGIEAWDYHDDAFMDLIDIKLAILFDRSGKLEATKELIGNDNKKIEQEIHKSDTELKPKVEQSEATKMLAKPLDNNGWN